MISFYVVKMIIKGSKKDKNGNKQQINRKDTFSITAASEVMAICCLSKNLEDLKIDIIEDDFIAIEDEMIRHNVVKLAFYIFSTLLNK